MKRKTKGKVYNPITEINGVPVHMVSRDDKWATMSFHNYNHANQEFVMGSPKGWEIQSLTNLGLKKRAIRYE